jgi:hypothetical protein
MYINADIRHAFFPQDSVAAKGLTSKPRSFECVKKDQKYPMVRRLG